MNGRVAKDWSDDGAYTLSYEPSNGGYAIQQYSGTGGGVHFPFGERRRPAGEMWSAMHFALAVVGAIKRNHK
jgi:hypothetical protein